MECREKGDEESLEVQCEGFGKIYKLSVKKDNFTI